MDIKSISEKSVCVNPFRAHGKSKAEDKHIQKNLDTSSKTRKYQQEEPVRKEERW